MSPDSTAPPIALGLVLVHGVGEQGRGTTLLTWLDTIVGTIEAATAGRVSVEVERATLSGGGASPPHAVVRLRGEGVDERWLAAEAWWAQAFVAPSFGQLASWSFRAVPWTIAMHVAQRYRRLNGVARGPRRPAARLLVAGQLLAAMLLAPFVVLALALCLLVAPCPSMRFAPPSTASSALSPRARATAWCPSRARSPRLRSAARSRGRSGGSRDNRDGFVLPVVRLLAEEAGSTWLGRLRSRGPDGREAGADRSRGWLRAARWLIPLPWALVALTRGPDLETLRLWAVGSGDPFGGGRWLSWVPPATWAFAFRWGAVAAAAWLSYRIALAAWLAWTRAEQDLTLRQGPPKGVSAGLRLFGLATTAVLLAALALARADLPGDASWGQIEIGSALFGLAVLGLWSQILVAVAAWLFPPPRPAAPPAPGADAPA